MFVEVIIDTYSPCSKKQQETKMDSESN